MYPTLTMWQKLHSRKLTLPLTIPYARAATSFLEELLQISHLTRISKTKNFVLNSPRCRKLSRARVFFARASVGKDDFEGERAQITTAESERITRYWLVAIPKQNVRIMYPNETMWQKLHSRKLTLPLTIPYHSHIFSGGVITRISHLTHISKTKRFRSKFIVL